MGSKKKGEWGCFKKSEKIRGRPKESHWFADLSKSPKSLALWVSGPSHIAGRAARDRGHFCLLSAWAAASHGILRYGRYGKPWPLIGVLGVVEKPNFETSKVSRIRGSHLIRCVIGTTLSLVHNALQCATEPRTRSQLQGRPSWWQGPATWPRV